MLKRLGFWSSAVLAGVLLGLGATALFLQREGMGGDIASGPWRTSMGAAARLASKWLRTPRSIIESQCDSWCSQNGVSN